MNELHLISLGAGVQSSTMALMAAAGEITPMPYAAIFADTKAETASVYKWLDRLEKQLPFPVIRKSRGDLAAEALRLRTSKGGKLYTKSAVPTFIKNPDGSRGMMQRQCTYDFKLMVLQKAAINLLSESSISSAVQWVGISLDEAHRMKPSRHPKIVCRWPLVDLRLTRWDCLRWMEKNGYPKPPKSACTFCPYHSDAEWIRLKKEEPEAFKEAVAFDYAYRSVKAKTHNISGAPYLHSSLVPLDQVDFSTDEDNGQQVMFGNECEGMCGV